MNRRFSSHLLWGYHSPLSSLVGAALIVIVSSRFSFALICAGALLWVYGLTALVFSGAKPIMPARGKKIILLFISTFLCGIYMLLTGLLNPLLVMGTGFSLLLIPPCCLGSGFFEASESVDIIDVFSRSLLEAIVLALIIIALALIREPLGMGTLSVPGGPQGIIELFAGSDPGLIIPVRVLSTSAGGLLLFGYGVALYRYFREQNGGVQGNSGIPLFTKEGR